ncbi:MAG: sulfatase-like hydrolase/transferase, partial [Halioglobus sp.]
LQQNTHSQKELSFLVILGVTGLAIADPVLKVFGATPELFSHFNLDTLGWMTAFALAVVFIPPIALWLVIRAIGKLRTTAGTAVGILLLCILAIAWGVQLGKWSLTLNSPAVITLLGIACAIIMLVGLRLWGAFHTLLQILAVVPIISLILFLSTSQTSSLLANKQLGTVGAVSSNAHPSVLFLLLDEFPTGALIDNDGQIDAARYPNIAAFAQEATWYKNYSVLADSTRISVPSLLSGKAPTDTPATASEHPTNLFALLAPTHHLTAYETLTSLCAYRQCSEGPPGEIRKAQPKPLSLLHRAFKLWVTRVSPRASRVTARDDFQEELVEIVPVAQPEALEEKQRLQERLFIPEKMLNYAQAKPARLERFKNTFTAGQGPALYFMHLELPHSPWRFYEDGALYEATEQLALSREHSNRAQWMATVSEYRFMMQAKYTDSLVGGVIEKMKAQDLWDDTLVIVTADHGRSFKLHTDHRRAAWNTLDQIAFSPLLIKNPGQTEGSVDTSNVMAYDLVPTVADALNIKLPWAVDGFAVGDKRIGHRAHRKDFFFDEGKDFFVKKLGERQLFSMKKEFPLPMLSRFIKTPNAESAFNSLLSELDSFSLIGKAVSDFSAEAGGQVTVSDLARLQKPGEQYPLGMVMGTFEANVSEHVDAHTDNEEIVIAINGRFATASPLFKFIGKEDTFLAMLPNGALAQENTLTFFLFRNGKLFSLSAKES